MYPFKHNVSKEKLFKFSFLTYYSLYITYLPPVVVSISPKNITTFTVILNKLLIELFMLAVKSNLCFKKIFVVSKFTESSKERTILPLSHKLLN